MRTMGDYTFVLVAGLAFYGLMYLFTRTMMDNEVHQSEPLGPLHISPNDVTTVALIDFVTSFILQRTVPTLVWLVSMFVMFALSCVYVSVRANKRYEREVENLHKLFR